jgi:NAD(P)-dependent dehydrogenase (short-subunit alcohol dehydrogenase family)
MKYLVTGANRGLGLEFTRQLVDRGDRVIATCRRPDEADELNEIARSSDHLEAVLSLDVTDPDSVAQLAEALEDESLDVLINNAGRLSRGGSPEDFDYDEIHGDFEVNAVGPLRVAEAALPALRRGEGKKIVNVTSKMGSIEDNDSGGSYAYRMSKAALNMAIRSLAWDLKPEGFVAFVIHPGWVQTRMGGSNAQITPQTSVSNIIARADEADADDSGQFLEWDGGHIPW